jgi:hypothetical protein
VARLVFALTGGGLAEPLFLVLAGGGGPIRARWRRLPCPRSSAAVAPFALVGGRGPVTDSFPHWLVSAWRSLPGCLEDLAAPTLSRSSTAAPHHGDTRPPPLGFSGAALLRCSLCAISTRERK